MNVPVRYGLILGIAVSVINLAIPALGLHTSMGISAIFLVVVIAINLAVVILALRQTAADANYGGQVLNGLILGVVGGAIVFVGSWLTTSVVFPNYMAEVAQATRDTMASFGLPAEDIEEQLAGASSVSSAFQGALGTVITSVVVAAITAIFKRAGKA